MIHDESITGFVDVVSGGFVKYWVDCNGKYWLAESRWSFRIPIVKPTKHIWKMELPIFSHWINLIKIKNDM
jgi:hypothetical protein